MAVARSTRSPTYARLQMSSASIASDSAEGRAVDRMHSRARRSYPIGSGRAVCDVGLAPFGTPGLEQDAWLAGMDPGERPGIRLGARWRGRPHSRAASVAAAVRGTRL